MNLTPNSGVAAPTGGFMANFFAKETPAALIATDPVTAPVPATEPVTPTAPEPVTTEPVKEVTEPAKEEAAVDPALNDLDVFNKDKADEPVKPAEEPEEEIPAGVTTKAARESWKAGRVAIKKAAALEAEVAKLRETSGKLSDADPVRKENETLKARVAELEPVIARVDYQKSAAYDAAVGAPMRQIGTVAQQIAKQYEIPDDRMIAALQEPDRKRQSELIDEVCESMTTLDKGEVVQMANELRRLFIKDEEMSANAVAARKEAESLEAKEREQQSLTRKAEEMRAVEDLKPKVEKIAKFLVKEGVTPEAFAAQMAEKANAVPFGEQPPGQQAYLTYAGLLLPGVLELVKDLKTQLAAKDKTVAAMSAASPRANNGAAANSGDAKKPGGFFEGFTGQAPPWAKR